MTIHCSILILFMEFVCYSINFCNECFYIMPDCFIDMQQVESGIHTVLHIVYIYSIGIILNQDECVLACPYSGTQDIV